MSAEGRAAAVITALALALALPARADTIDVAVTTLVAGHQDPRDGQLHTVVPIYQSLTASATEIRNPWIDDLAVVVSGWGEVAFGDPLEGRATGDVDIGFLEGKLWKRRIELRLGRQLILGGAARVTPLDGLAVTLRLYRGLHATAYAGAPVTPRFADSRGDFAAGGRLFFRHSFATEIGASAIEVLGAGRVARQDVALDARWAPEPGIAFTGLALYSLRELRVAQAELTASWRVAAPLELEGDYRRTAPDLFLPRTSILSVFSQETREEVGAFAALRPAPPLELRADYHLISEPQGLGHRAGGKAAVRLGRERHTTVGAELRVLDLPENGYTQARLYALRQITEGLVATLDLDAYRLARAVNGQTLSFTASATLGWAFTPGWRAVIAGFADTNPLVERRFELIAKLVWDRGLHFREVKR